MHVDTNHGIFSSDSTLGGISIRDVPPGYDYPSFIAMDQPLTFGAAQDRVADVHADAPG